MSSTISKADSDQPQRKEPLESYWKWRIENCKAAVFDADAALKENGDKEPGLILDLQNKKAILEEAVHKALEEKPNWETDQLLHTGVSNLYAATGRLRGTLYELEPEIYDLIMGIVKAHLKNPGDSEFSKIVSMETVTDEKKGGNDATI